MAYMKSKNITQLYWGYNLQQIIFEVMLKISERGHLPTTEGGAHLAIGLELQLLVGIMVDMSIMF